MGFITGLLSVSEATSDYGVKTYEQSYTAYSTWSVSNFVSWPAYTKPPTAPSGSEQGFITGEERRSSTRSECYTKTYQSSFFSSRYLAANTDSDGSVNSGSSSLTVSETAQTERTFGLDSVSQVKQDYLGNSEEISARYTQTTLTNTDLSPTTYTAWTVSGGSTTRSPSGSGSSFFGFLPFGTAYSLETNSATTIFPFSNSTTVSTTKTNTFYYYPIYETKTYTDITTASTYNSSGISGVRTFKVTTIKILGSGPKSYTSSILCDYDKTGNLIFTLKSSSGFGIRDSNRDFLLSPTGDTTISWSEVTVAYNPGQTTGFSSAYTLTSDFLSYSPTSVTRTFVSTIMAFGTGDGGVLYSTWTRQEGLAFSIKTSQTEAIAYGQTLTTRSVGGSHFSLSCKQMIKTTANIDTFLFAQTLTTSYQLRTYIYTTTDHFYFVNDNRLTGASLTESGKTTASGPDGDTTDRESGHTYHTSNYSVAAKVVSSLYALSTRYKDTYSPNSSTTYYTEALSAGNFINGEGKPFFEYSPPEASECAFRNSAFTPIVYGEAQGVYSYPRPTVRLFPYSGTFRNGTTSFTQLFSEAPSATTFYQTVKTGTDESMTSTRSINYRLTNSSVIGTSQQTSLFVDSVMYSSSSVGIPHIFPNPADILNSVGYFASAGSYLLNDAIRLKSSGSGTGSYYDYINGTETFSEAISKSGAETYYPTGSWNFYGLSFEHGVFTADKVYGNAQIFGNSDRFPGYGGIFMGTEFRLVSAYPPRQ